MILGPWPVASTHPATIPEGTVGRLTTTNSAGRTGAFYLPADFASSPLPLLVAIHGTGGVGASMVSLLRPAADRYRFIVVAPDSRRSPAGDFTWEVPSNPGETTEDQSHVARCVQEVLAMPGIRVEPGKTLIAGHSAGASTAAYEASVDDSYGAFAVLHGGVFAGRLNARPVRGWFSTGTADAIRPPAVVRRAVDQAMRAGLGPIVYREFQEGHEVGTQELDALVEWWLRINRVDAVDAG
jgi:poly(3-hydroxybutyrate) depolymerase